MTASQPEFKQIYKHASWLNVGCVIAGGAAIDFERAADIDVFVFSERRGRFQRFLDRLDPHFKTHISPYASTRGFFVIGECQPSWSRKPIQIITQDVDDERELLRTFDLSVHQWAVMPDGYRVRVETSTLPGQLIRVLRWDDQTLQRTCKLYQRYGCAEVDAA